MREQRGYRAEFRVVDGSEGRQFWAMGVAYEVVDDYGSIWTRSVFDKSVREKFPSLMWGHAGWNDIAQMMGGGIDYRDTNGGAEVLMELLDADENPNTNTLAGLMKQRAATGKPFVRDVSVGFDREEWDGPNGQRSLAPEDREMRDRKGHPAVERIRVAGWDELSVVVAGAVPGAKTLTGVRSVRTASGLSVPVDSVVELARKMSDGELSHDAAQAALRLLAGEPAPDPVVESGGDELSDDELEAALASTGAALESLED